MNSSTLGVNTSVVEVTHIDSRSMWLYVDGKEHYMPFDEFPWFAEATVRQISNVERQGSDHFHWPSLDVDLTLDMIDYPAKYPRKFR
ncbi:MAG: DUF2442 domain-containing protein [Kiritimatiellae bacterium]|nr:DUF2442 domain-containing protein [Kiritimatiellia bacterium]